MKRINSHSQDSKSLLPNSSKFESINAKLNKNKSYNLRSFIFMDQVLTKKELEELPKLFNDIQKALPGNVRKTGIPTYQK